MCITQTNFKFIEIIMIGKSMKQFTLDYMFDTNIILAVGKNILSVTNKSMSIYCHIVCTHFSGEP